MYHEIAIDLLLLIPGLTDDDYLYDGAIYAPICGPLTVILVFGALGYIVKRFIAYPKTIVKRIIYDYIVYNLFIIVSLVFILPLFYNSVQFIILVSSGVIGNETKLAYIGLIFSYFGLISTLLIVYLFIYKTNPKIGQGDGSWIK